MFCFILQEEHEAIVRKRENPDSALTWSEYKSMTFTFQVNKALSISLVNFLKRIEQFIFLLTNLNLQIINETVRLANIVPGIFRKALQDVNFKGMHFKLIV